MRTRGPLGKRAPVTPAEKGILKLDIFNSEYLRRPFHELLGEGYDG